MLGCVVMSTALDFICSKMQAKFDGLSELSKPKDRFDKLDELIKLNCKFDELIKLRRSSMS